MEHSDKNARAGSGVARHAAWVGLACAAVAAAHAALLAGHAGPVDDDYIVWRYARNWVEHGVYAFNVADGPSDGVSSPLWFVVCALAVAAGLGPGTVSPALGCAAFVALVFVVARTATRAFGSVPAGVLAGTALALQPALGWHAWAGLGTLPCALCVGLGASALLEGRDRAAGVALGVAAGFRMEVAPVALLMAAWSPGPRAGLARALPAAGVAVLALLVRYAVFGRALPATGLVKALPLADELGYGARYFVRSPFEGGLVLFLAVAAAQVASRTSTRPLRSIAVGALGALLVVLVVGGDWMVFGRFLVPWAALGALGAAALVARARSSAVASALALGTVGVTLYGFAALGPAVHERAEFEGWWLSVGDALHERAPRGASVALSPIGAVGWRSALPVVDVLGLTHSAFLELEPQTDPVKVKGHHRFDGAWVLDQEPTYLILGNGILFEGEPPVRINPWERDIVSDPRFARDYVRRTAVVDCAGRPTPLPYARLRTAPDL